MKSSSSPEINERQEDTDQEHEQMINAFTPRTVKEGQAWIIESPWHAGNIILGRRFEKKPLQQNLWAGAGASQDSGRFRINPVHPVDKEDFSFRSAFFRSANLQIRAAPQRKSPNHQR
jgi:hypothetical protein